jgi:hypothetical protein
MHRDRMPLVAVALVGVIAGCGMVQRGRQTIGGLVHPGRHAIVAHYESPPDWVLGVPPCDAKTIPQRGVCRGVGHSTKPTTITGDWEGRTEYAYGWLTLPSAVNYGVNLETFAGTVKECGTGSITYRMFGSCDLHGQCTYEWHTIDGLGTGDLASLHGRGTMTGVFRDDFSSAGDFRGWVRCPH